MNALRSIVFNFFFIFGSLFLSVAMLWALFLPKRKALEVVSGVYGGYITFIEEKIMGLRLNIEGMEHFPKTPCIIAAKHQSAYETLKLPFMREFNYPAIVLKKELTRLPLWGFYPLRMGEIAIDRSRGAAALRSMLAGCRRALGEGRHIMIFPQGTRVPVGVKIPYKSGLAKLYRDLDVPIVPMALNAGVFWGRNAFFKKSGTVTFRFLPPIPPGLPYEEAMERLERVLEEESDRLVAAATHVIPAKAGMT